MREDPVPRLETQIAELQAAGRQAEAGDLMFRLSTENAKRERWNVRIVSTAFAVLGRETYPSLHAAPYIEHLTNVTRLSSSKIASGGTIMSGSFMLSWWRLRRPGSWQPPRRVPRRLCRSVLRSGRSGGRRLWKRTDLEVDHSGCRLFTTQYYYSSHRKPSSLVVARTGRVLKSLL